MIQITNVETFGWETAIRGMRNPMNSWEKSDSYWTVAELGKDDILMQTDCEGYMALKIGPNDQELMLKLAKSGSDHAKFRRMINVTMDILAPLYWWKEFDTYKVGTVANSTSTMHKIHAKEFTIDDFSHEHLLNEKATLDDEDPSLDVLEHTIEALNKWRDKYLYDKDKLYWWQMIQLLPSSYNQLRTVQLNYEVLSNIYRARKDHKLDEWRGFCSMIEGLPYSEIITLKE